MTPPGPFHPDRVLALTERQLSPAEVDAYLSVPMSDAEREDIRALRAWFTRRYPTGAERLAYVRRAYRRWVSDPRTDRRRSDPTTQSGPSGF